MPHGRKPPDRRAKMEEDSSDEETEKLNNEAESPKSSTEYEIDVSRIDSLHMKAWFGMAFRYPASPVKLVWDLWQWMFDYGSLIATLILGSLFDQSYDNIGWTILTHITSCIVMLAIEWTSKQQTTTNFKDKLRLLLSRFAANIFMILKPIRTLWYNFIVQYCKFTYRRYIQGFRYRKEASKIVRDKFKLRKELSDEEINVVIAINEKELDDDYYNLIFTFIQSVPLCLLQLHIIFSTREKLQLCSQADFSRLLMIMSTIFSIAKSTADYNWNYNNYIQSLHFLDYYTSNFTHEMNVISTQNHFTYAFHLLSNLILSVHRFYCISFFLSVSQLLCAVYIFTTFLTQWAILIISPSLRYSLENAPIGIHSFCSELFDRWVNVFTLHMMNWNSLTRKTYKVYCKFKIPLSLVHLIPFAISMLAVFLVTYTTGGIDEHIEILRSVMPALQNRHVLNSTENEILIPCTNSSFHSNINWIQSIGSFILTAHHKVTNRFVSFNDLFGVIHFLPFSMYAYMCVSITYSYYLHWFKLDDMKFPVQLAYKYWLGFLKIRDQDSNIKMLVLTLVSHTRFYSIRRKNICCFKVRLMDYLAISRSDFDFQKHDWTWWNDEIEKLTHFSEYHNEIKEFYEYLASNVSKKDDLTEKQLVWLFLVRFYHQMSVMTSHRIKHTIDLVVPSQLCQK